MRLVSIPIMLVGLSKSTQNDVGGSPNDVLAAHAPQRMAEGAPTGMPVGWQNDDLVQIFYAEHVLAAWVLQGSPWTAYHSGFTFKNTRTGASYCIDYCPVYTDDVRVVLAPELTPVSDSKPNWFSSQVARVKTALGLPGEDAHFAWRNHGRVRFYTAVPEKYTNFTHLADIDGQMFHKMIDWALEYNNTHDTFDPVEIVIEGAPEKRVSSRMCHDLVTAGLWKLYELGITTNPSDPIYRDHIILFAEDYEAVDLTDKAVKAEVVSYFRLFTSWLPLIAKEFTGIRGMLVHAAAASFHPFLYINHVYYRVHMTPPYVNYCYMPIPMPPAKANAFTSEKFCGLEQSLSKDSTDNFLEQAAGLGFVLKDRLRTWLILVGSGAVLAVIAVIKYACSRKDKKSKRA